MKKIFSIIIVAIIILQIGCTTTQKFKDPVKLYFPKNQPNYNDQDGIIGYQLSEGYSQSHQSLLSSYLNGPEDLNFYDPFPDNLRLVSLNKTGQLVTVVVSNELSLFTGIDATLACICLAKTIMELIDAEAVSIACESATIDGEQTLIISKDDILWMDESIGIPSISTSPTR